MTYHSDFYAWTREQARLLRERQLGDNRLDLDHIAEEIEDMGKSELRAVERFIVNIMVHLVKLAYSANHSAQRSWNAEIAAFHAELQDLYSSSMRQNIDLAKLWRRHKLEAERAFAAYDEALPALPETCPYGLDDFLAPALDVPALVARLG